MLHLIYLIILLPNTTCTYLEINGTPGFFTPEILLKWEVKPRNFYWFEWLTEIYLLYFGINKDNHKNPFLLFIAVPEAKNNSWPFPESEGLLEKTFDEFHKFSAFVSLSLNKQNRQYYSFSITIDGCDIPGHFRLSDTTLFMPKNFELKKLTSYTDVLKYLKFGTMSVSRFYEAESRVYGIFMETYYIIYKTRDENSKSVSLFRIGTLSEIVLATFKTYSTIRRVFLEDSEDEVFTFERFKDVEPKKKNVYCLNVFYPLGTISVSFSLEENRNQQFQFFFGYIRILEENAPVPKFEKLPQIGRMFYLFKNELEEEFSVEIEVPIYFVDKKLEVSKLIVPFSVISKEKSKTYKIDVNILIYDFIKEKNIHKLDDTNFYYLHFGYFVEINKLLFVITKITNSNEEIINLKQIASFESYNTVERTCFGTFLSGTIIYYQDSAVILEPNEVYSKESKIKPVTKDESKQSGDKNNIKIICLLVGLVLVGVCFASKWLVRIFKKRLSKRRKLNKNKTR